jgi:hypothetical protein
MRIPVSEEDLPAAVNAVSRRPLRALGESLFSQAGRQKGRPTLLLIALLAVVPRAFAAPPRLAVVVVVDQMRADYLERFRPFFGTDGFQRLLSDGAVYTNCHHRHALTATAPGHATLLTGVHANRHGIIDNDWLDRSDWRRGGAVADRTAALVGTAAVSPGPGGVWSANAGASPHRLLASTVGDELKLRHGSRSRVIAVGTKDRAPILMGGRLADGAYWLHEGRFVSSRFYREALPEWVANFNAEQRVEAVFGQTWERLLAPDDYERIQGPDDAPGEESRLGLGTTFPRHIDGGLDAPGGKFYEAYRLVPMMNDLLVDFAERAIAGEQLGRHEAPDLLCVGFSQLDHAGHSYGPDSHEIMDSLVRLDRAIGRLLAVLDRDVGKNNYTLVLSADHGVAPLPERVNAFGRGLTAGRLDGLALDRGVSAALDSAFGPAPDGTTWVMRDGSGYFLVPAALAAREVSALEAAKVVTAALRQSTQIAVAWSRDDLLGQTGPADAPHLAGWRLSYHAERSPDVVFSLAPHIVDRSPDGTNHRSPYVYDTHVPLVWYGAGVAAGRHSHRVGTDALAPTLAGLLGLPPPPEAAADPLF